MWIETEYYQSYNIEKYDKMTLSTVTSIIYLIAEGKEGINLYTGDDYEQAKGVYEWIMQCLDKERSVCRISDAPVLRDMPEERVTTWRMQ
jgi:hypothetical protein